MSESNTQSVFKSKWMLLGLLAIAVVGALVFVSPDFGEDTSNMGGTMAPDSPTDHAPEGFCKCYVTFGNCWCPGK